MTGPPPPRRWRSPERVGRGHRLPEPMHKAADDPFAPTGIELLGIEPLEEHARRLAALFTVSPRRRGSSAHLKRLRQHSRALRRVYTVLAIDAKRGEPPSPAAEWLLDNFHLVLTTLRDIRHDLPVAFFRRLPWIAADEFAGLPRIYAMALELIRLSAGRLDAQRVHRFVTAFQSVTPLTMGELWAWPSALKLALVEHLRTRGDILATSRVHRLDADRLVDALETPAPSRQRWPSQVHPAFVIRLLQRSREHPAAADLRGELDAALRARGPGDRGRDSLRGAASGGRAGVHGQPDRQPPFDRDLRLERILRERQSGRASASTRPGRGVCAHGLRQPRSVPACGRRDRGTDRRGAGARRAEVCRTRTAGRRTLAGRARGARRLLPGGRRPAAVRARHRMGAGTAGQVQACLFPARDAVATWGRSPSARRHSWRRPSPTLSLTAGNRRC